MGGLSPPSWHPEGDGLSAAGCFVVFPRGRSGPGTDGDSATAAAVIARDGRATATRIVHGLAGARYAAGLLYLREGQVLEEVVRQLPDRPDVLVVNGTGLDHPRYAGMALHLGYLLDLPTVGVTRRPPCMGGMAHRCKGENQSPNTRRTACRLLGPHTGWRTATGGTCRLENEPGNRCRGCPFYHMPGPDARTASLGPPVGPDRPSGKRTAKALTIQS